MLLPTAMTSDDSIDYSKYLTPPYEIVRESLSMDSFNEPIWKISVEKQFRKIATLKENWDGFQAGPIRSDVLSYVKLLLNEVMEPLTPPPHISPMSHEGIMLEWHNQFADLEIEIEIPGKAWVEFNPLVPNTGLTPNEWEISSDVRLLIAHIEFITHPPI